MDTEKALALARLGESTDRLLATADGLTDTQAAGPSRLPGWTRGHILTHLARNADGFRNLLTWARTGTETPMYPSEEARDRSIEAGAGRSAAELRRTCGRAPPRSRGGGRSCPPGAWDATVSRRGDRFPARVIAGRGGWSELEIHHVDLGAGYEPGDWPVFFVQETLARVAARLRRAPGRTSLPGPPGWPGGRLPDRPGQPGLASTQYCQHQAAGPVTVSGPPAVVLAWLIGRDSGGRARGRRGPRPCRCCPPGGNRGAGSV